MQNLLIPLQLRTERKFAGIFAIHARRQYADKYLLHLSAIFGAWLLRLQTWKVLVLMCSAGRSWTKSSFYFIDLMGSEVDQLPSLCMQPHTCMFTGNGRGRRIDI